MKKLIIILSVFLLVTSCKETLVEYNPSGITADAVFTTPTGFETLVNAAYGYQRWWYGKEEGYNITEMGTDLWMSAAGDIAPDLSQYKDLQGTQSNVISQEWSALYQAVNLCNAGLSRIGNAGLLPARKVQLEGELRFLRAFYYWHIVETWGGVHFTLDETNTIITTANKTPVETFYTQIFEDLQFAVKNITATTTDYGRVTKPAAMSFLARMYLTRGMYAQANATAKAVISGNYGYKLEANYADLWKMSNEKSKEVIYAVNYAKDLTYNDIKTSTFSIGHSRGSNNGHMMFLMKYDDQPRLARITEYGRPFNRYMPTRALMDLYSDDDARYAGSYQETWFSVTKTSDANAGYPNIGDTAVIATRKVYSGAKVVKDAAGKVLKTVYDRNSIYNADGTVKDRLHYPSLTKFMDPTRAAFNEAQSARDVFVIRFAELYLIAAEAKMNLGDKDSAAYYVNIIRTRAAKAGKAAAMQISPAQVTLDFILDERAREFAGEQIRWFDLKRTGKLIDRVKALNPDIAPNIDAHHLVRPIPQSQLDAITNKDEFKQNEGYK
jgi:starch-binding outer membrane protein, SusD/RagB family